jgi:hypothetical protein
MLTQVWLTQTRFLPHGVPSSTRPWSGKNSCVPSGVPLVDLVVWMKRSWVLIKNWLRMSRFDAIVTCTRIPFRSRRMSFSHWRAPFPKRLVSMRHPYIVVNRTEYFFNFFFGDEKIYCKLNFFHSRAVIFKFHDLISWKVDFFGG